MKLSPQEKDRLLNARLTEEWQEHNRRIQELLPEGTNLAAYSVNFGDVRRNPYCCLTLLNHGAAVDFDTPPDCYFVLWNTAFSTPFAFMAIAPPLINQCVRQYTCSFLDKMVENALEMILAMPCQDHLFRHKFTLEFLLEKGGIISDKMLAAYTEQDPESVAYFQAS